MTTQRANSEDGEYKITPRITRSMTSTRSMTLKMETQPKAGRRITRRLVTLENAKISVPMDIVFAILSILPVKSVARFRCVSKEWSSMIRSPEFTKCYLTGSLARPRLLFACQKSGELSILSSPQRGSLDENPQSPVAADSHMSFPYNEEWFPTPVHGLFCVRYPRNRRRRNGIIPTRPMICNPSNGQMLRLPKVETGYDGVCCYLGYVPSEKQHKVLAMTCSDDPDNYYPTFEEHQVLTLGGSGRKLSWRMIDCDVPHFSTKPGICVDGVLYYRASEDAYSPDSMIVCFDVKSEKFSSIDEVDQDVRFGTLIDYHGKLGSVLFDYNVEQGGAFFELWVLRSFEKQEWSKEVSLLPPLWKNILGPNYFGFLGVTPSNELVLASDSQTSPFYVFYYSMERKTLTRVEIQGLDVVEGNRIFTYLNHVEDVKFM